MNNEAMKADFEATINKCGDVEKFKSNSQLKQGCYAYFIHGWQAALSQQPSTDALQCKIDNLMLEYCPDEMTKEQIENWEKHQIPSRNSDAGIPI